MDDDFPIETTETRLERRKRILKRISALSREPMQEALAGAMAAEPSVDAIRRFAEKYPDRWAQMVAIFSRLSGYSETTVKEVHWFTHIQQMSDAEIRQRRAEVLRQLEVMEPENEIREKPAVAGLVERNGQFDKSEAIDSTYTLEQEAIRNVPEGEE